MMNISKSLKGLGLKSLALAVGMLSLSAFTPSFAYHGGYHGGYHYHGGYYHGGYYRGYRGGYYRGYYRRGYYPYYRYGYGGGYVGPGFMVGTAAAIITGAAIANSSYYGCRRVYTRCGVFYDSFGYPHRTCSRYFAYAC